VTREQAGLRCQPIPQSQGSRSGPPVALRDDRGPRPWLEIRLIDLHGWRPSGTAGFGKCRSGCSVCLASGDGYAAPESCSSALMTTGHVGAEMSATVKWSPSTSSRRASWPAARAAAT
jgi:hypothetical protein